MQEDGLPPFIAMLASAAIIVGVIIAAVILGVVMLMPANAL